uniref:acetyl-CoA C-acetyltransferase n=1 Tax=Eptatretus burgeri TaxID=7764 RepID=A0A8C4QEN5_EPTBU
MDRLQVLLKHVSPRNGHLAGKHSMANEIASPTSDSDVVVVHGVRTPIGRAKRGVFKDIMPDELLSHVMVAILKATGLPASKLGDICVGNVLQPGAGALMARIAQINSGIPEAVPIYCVNRQCSSGLQACMNIAGGIRNGSYDIGLACGVESMSHRSKADPRSIGDISAGAFHQDATRDCLLPMGITSENVAEQFGVSREKQDAFALASHQKAARATRLHLFQEEIVPMQSSGMLVEEDEGIRPNTTLEKLAHIPPAFKENGTTTAGNSSQLSDGAAAVLLARRGTASALGLPILGVLRSFAVLGVPPAVMGIGPAYAIPAALKKCGLSMDDIDIFEVNEAFASQAVYCAEKLGIPPHKLNPNGGAIALGHPLGCTGTRQVVSLLHELRRRKSR